MANKKHSEAVKNARRNSFSTLASSLDFPAPTSAVTVDFETVTYRNNSAPTASEALKLIQKRLLAP